MIDHATMIHPVRCPESLWAHVSTDRRLPMLRGAYGTEMQSWSAARLFGQILFCASRRGIPLIIARIPCRVELLKRRWLSLLSIENKKWTIFSKYYLWWFSCVLFVCTILKINRKRNCAPFWVESKNQSLRLIRLEYTIALSLERLLNSARLK